MTNEPDEIKQEALITPDEAARLDAEYKLILDFPEWARHSHELDELAVVWERVEALRTHASDDDHLDRAIQIALRAAAVETGAIEDLYERPPMGLTFSIALSAISWETEMRAHDETLPDFFHAALEAYKLAFEVAKSLQPITEVWIRELHEALTRPQATYKALTNQGWAEIELPKGAYKTLPNHVLQPDGEPHAYAPVDLTGSEMNRLVGQIASPPFQEASPILQAAYAHHSLTVVHPFADGNGRVARALASVFLRRQLLIPFLMFAHQRPQYFEALTTADEGHTRKFSQFVLDRVLDSLTIVALEIGPRPDEYVSRLSRLHEARDGLSHVQLDQNALALRAKIISAIADEFKDLPLPTGIQHDAKAHAKRSIEPGDHYRHTISEVASIRMTASSAAPAVGQAQRFVAVLVSVDSQAYYAFRVVSSVQGQIPLDVRLSDVHPDATPTLDKILRSWCSNLVADALKEVVEQGEESLRKSGYTG